MNKPICPICGEENLEFCKKLIYSRSHKINKNGEISKKSSVKFLEETEVEFIECIDCGFVYNLTYTDNNSEPNEELNKWYYGLVW
jgi:Zn ribbon nucleic-acid-binding protein|uniref:Putative zinc binding domain n=1 Tax=Siphoviridae sp. cthL03 TaxID=2825615 RepID=A0A8S5PG64_9CAUD|nr:hypothetical protein [uncultured Lachnoclostridium sp.]DAE05605.1 MAG TPA: putative zinc binding domain [Siphoviridae sp. cthL03]